VEETLRFARGLSVDGTNRSVSTERLEALFDTQHLRLYHLARRLTGDAEDARDLVQQTFLRAARGAARIPSDAAGAEAWIVRILINLCRDRGRRLRVRRRMMPPGSDTGRAEAIDPAPTPDRAAMARSTVQRALASLPARRRAVVVLHDIEDRDVREIAGLLGIARVTVRWHLAAGRRQLKEILLGPTAGEESAHEA
jgi:RNA polymerase sigma-70 factor, ECF subfamily